MKKVVKICFLCCVYIFVVLQLGCKKDSKKEFSPITIQTFVLNGNNYVRNILALKDNSFLIHYIDDQKSINYYLHFSEKLKLLDSISMKGYEFTSPVLGDDQTIVFTGYTDNGYLAFMLNYQMQVIETRIINFLLKSIPGKQNYPALLTRLSGGQYVLGYLSVGGDGHQMNLFGVNDFFKTNKVNWRYLNPELKKDWVHYLFAGPHNDIYTTAFDNNLHQENFLKRYDANGKMIFSASFPAYSNFTPVLAFADENRIIFDDFLNYYFLDTSGNIQSDMPSGNGWSNSHSTLVKIGSFYYYYADYLNQDGKYLELRKADENMKTVKSIRLGNLGTNLFIPVTKKLIKLQNNKLVVAALVENPSLSGNHWLLAIVNQDLEAEIK